MLPGALLAKAFGTHSEAVALAFHFAARFQLLRTFSAATTKCGILVNILFYSTNSIVSPKKVVVNRPVQ
jgi:hypothetical protein